MWQAACGGKGTDDLAAALLLLPDGFSLLPGDEILQVALHPHAHALHPPSEHRIIYG